MHFLLGMFFICNCTFVRVNLLSRKKKRKNPVPCESRYTRSGLLPNWKYRDRDRIRVFSYVQH